MALFIQCGVLGALHNKKVGLPADYCSMIERNYNTALAVLLLLLVV